MDDNRGTGTGTGSKRRPAYAALGLSLMGTMGLCEAHLPRATVPGRQPVAAPSAVREPANVCLGTAHEESAYA
jgi:hypothetical protein